MKKNNKMVRTNFARHDARISGGEAEAFEGWLDAGVECFTRFGGNASAYAASAVSLRWTGRNDLTQKESTIRQYVSAVVRLMKKHKSRAAIIKAYDSVYLSREISALMRLSKTDKKGKGKSRSQDTVAVTKRRATAFVNKFVPANKREEAMEALGF